MLGLGAFRYRDKFGQNIGQKLMLTPSRKTAARYTSGAEPASNFTLTAPAKPTSAQHAVSAAHTSTVSFLNVA
jgi:hypothetical protein